jgi:hypothetical protein
LCERSGPDKGSQKCNRKRAIMKPYVVRMKKTDSVFVLEDSESRMKWFYEQFPKLVWADTADKAIAILAEKQFDWVFLDHDLGLLDYTGANIGDVGNGQEVAKFLSGQNWVGHNVVIHSWNPACAAKMKDLLKGATAIPFGQFDIEFICVS